MEQCRSFDYDDGYRAAKALESLDSTMPEPWRNGWNDYWRDVENEEA